MLVLFSVVVRQKVTINENESFKGHAFGIHLLDCSKLAINRKKDNAVNINRNVIIVNFFCRFRVSFVKFSYWSNFHVNIIIGSRVVIGFLYIGLNRNPEIGNTPVGVSPNIWKLGQFRDDTFSMNVSNKMLLNAAKCHGNRFYRF